VTPEEIAVYCRQLESHLCQKNGGHLVRIVGPSFEQVRSWAERGVPLRIALRGIDRCCERAAARGPRRRPVRVEFCEADVLELFDDWRRALGAGVGEAGPDQPTSRKPALAAHIEKVISRLVGMRTDVEALAPPPSAVDAAVRQLDTLVEPSRVARGTARAQILDTLAEIDARLLGALDARIDPVRRAAIEREAGEDVAHLGESLAPEARALARRAAFLRLAREQARLPQVAFD
jgi:hypothetical protein